MAGVGHEQSVALGPDSSRWITSYFCNTAKHVRRVKFSDRRKFNELQSERVRYTSPCCKNTLGVMIRLLLAIVAFATNIYANAEVVQPAKLAADAITAARPDVSWDRETLVEGDFNGDGKPDFAMVGYKNEKLVLAVRMSSAKQQTYRNDFLVFSIDPSIQAAICEAPAKLTVEEQDCHPMDEPLPGCRPSRTAKSLTLSDGECDPINLYWNHNLNRMEWWRL
jgi:hypothetical protein